MSLCPPGIKRLERVRKNDHKLVKINLQKVILEETPRKYFKKRRTFAFAAKMQSPAC